MQVNYSAEKDLTRLSTQAIYYNETVLHEINQTKIGGVEGRSMKKEEGCS